ncbi:ECSIT protein, partial [Donacobius atricapilla]|nr:ECSIT protein [Donacobius atricapilla]
PPPDPERSFYFPLHLELELERGPWDDEDFDVEEGEVWGVRWGGSGGWISALQRQNPALANTPVLFRLAQGLGDPPAAPLGAGTPP